MKTILFCLFCVLTFVDSAKILAILHVPAQSHYYMGEALLQGLAEKGHDVTVASPFKSKFKHVNFKEIYLDGLKDIVDAVRPDVFNMVARNPISLTLELISYTNAISESTLRNSKIKNLVKSGEKFDVLIVEPFGNEAFFGLAHIFNSHLVVLSTACAAWVNQYSGNVAPFSFVPFWTTSFSDKMSLYQRFINIIAVFSFQILNRLFSWPVQKRLYEEMFDKVPSFEATVKNVSLFLVNSHVVYESPRPYMPNMIPVGGLHVKKPKKLPQDLQKYLDNANEGVIYFSLGSNIHSQYLPFEKQKAILNTFSKFPQKVLWKFEDANLPNKPSNVKIGKWFPQSDILAHPNVRLFITHGGLLSTIETVFRGVPIIGIPFYGDQFSNVANLVNSGYGQYINMDELDEKSFTNVIEEVINNKSYDKNIKKSAALLEDQPNKPLDRAIFWVEHVIRQNGARHLRSASVDQPLYQYLLFDVICVVSIVFSIFIIILYKLLRILCCKKIGNEDVKTKKAKPKKE